MIGSRFSRWQVVSKGHRPYYFICVCDCGKSKEVYRSSLKNGKSKSCGCLNEETCRSRDNKFKTHGHSNTPTYRSWLAMRRRCNSQSAPDYKNYGGRGIAVHQSWNSFERFLSDMGHRPPGRTLERIDVNGNYEPNNCMWATSREQAINTRSSVHLNANGSTKHITEWARETGVGATTIRERLRRGWSVDDAVSIRPMKKGVEFLNEQAAANAGRRPGIKFGGGASKQTQVGSGEATPADENFAGGLPRAIEEVE